MNYSYNFNDKKKSIKKRRIFLIISIVIVLLFTGFLFKNSNNSFMNTTSNILLAPINGLSSLFRGIGNGTKNYFSNAKKLEEENTSLKNQINDLQSKNLESQRILDENNSLKQMLKINTQFQHFTLKYANIVSREHDNWTQTFIINLGSKDGIKLNQPVVHEAGLVGYISKVDDSTSVVTTILDPTASVSVSISTINEPAILQGDSDLKSNNQLKLVYIPMGAEISNGDMLYTSGLGSYYPNGIPVGKVTKVVNNKNDIDRYAIVETSVNIRTISEVGIIIN